LMLAASLDPSDPCAAQSRECARWKMTPLRSMKHARIAHCLPSNSIAQHTRCVFDLRQLGHSRSALTLRSND